MAEQYTLPTPVWFEGTFKSKDTGLPADPADVTVKVWQEGDAPADVATFTYSGGTVERTGVGVYRVKATPTRGGRLYANFDGTGAVEVSQTEYAIINETGVPA